MCIYTYINIRTLCTILFWMLSISMNILKRAQVLEQELDVEADLCTITGHFVIKGKWPNQFLYTKMKACPIRSLRCSELKNLGRSINVAERKSLAFRGTYKNTITHLGRQTESQRQASVCFPGLLFSSVHYGWLQEGPSVHPGQQSHSPAAGGQRLPWTSHSGGEAPESAGEVHLWAYHSRSGLRERDTGQTY